MSGIPHRGDSASSTSFTPPDPLPNRFSPVQDLFRQTITHFQRQTLAQCLANAEADLKTYQTEISRLKATMILLKARRDDLQGAITKYRSLLSPIRRMPAEILSHIFSFYCDKNFITPESLPAAVVLSGVCGRWREHVFEAPRLWSQITVWSDAWADNTGAVTEQRSWQFRRLIELFMKRSKRQPLDLEFGKMTKDLLDALATGFSLFLRESYRWRSASFRRIDGGHHLTDPSSPFCHLKGHLPVLEHALLSFRSFEEADIMASDFVLLNECSKLNSIHIDGGTIPVGFDCDFPWSQIQTLGLSSCDSINILQMVPLCKNVESLTLECVHIETDNEVGIDNPPTTLSKTRQVSVRGPDQASFLFQAFSFPSLQSLEIRGPRLSTSAWNQDILTDFLNRSSCPITSLYLEDLSLSDNDAVHLLALIPTLTTLLLQERQFPIPSQDRARFQPSKNKIVTTTFLYKLAVNAEDSRSFSFLPRLKDLTLVVAPLDLSDREGLERALASRLTTLRTFSLVFISGRERSAPLDMSEYDDALQCFRDAGMRVCCSSREWGYPK